MGYTIVIPDTLGVASANRLSNYQVSISNKADFSTHTYQQDFHVAPNPKKIIQLDASGKQGPP
jgi:archaellum component FlaG (FlaF/FlaG flagellin family)